MMVDEEEVKRKILDNLKKVIDPEVGVNVVDLGLIKEINVKGDKAKIMMTLTVPSFICPLANYLMMNVKYAAESVSEISQAEINLIEPI